MVFYRRPGLETCILYQLQYRKHDGELSHVSGRECLADISPSLLGVDFFFDRLPKHGEPGHGEESERMHESRDGGRLLGNNGIRSERVQRPQNKLEAKKKNKKKKHTHFLQVIDSLYNTLSTWKNAAVDSTLQNTDCL